MQRTVVYIDGQNLHYNLTSMDLLEKDIDWHKLITDLVKPNYLIRAYWYQVAKIAPWEWNQRLEKYCPSNMDLDEFRRQAEEFYQREIERLENLQRKVYTRIEENFDSIEFRYAGVLIVNPTDWTLEQTETGAYYKIGKRVGEKGVDVAMAVDMVRQANAYDEAMIISGDYDFLPAIQAVKDSLKRVVVVSLVRGEPGSPWDQPKRLRSLCDVQKVIYESELKEKYRFNTGVSNTFFRDKKRHDLYL